MINKSKGEQSHKLIPWQSARGALLTLLIGILILVGNEFSPWIREAHIAWVLLLPVAYVASVGGVVVGLISAVIAIFFAMFSFLTIQAGVVHAHDLPHLIIFAIIAPFLVIQIGIVRHRTDIQERLKQSSQESYLSLLQSIDDIYFLVDLDGKIDIVSPSITAVAGFSEKELIGREAPWIADSGSKYVRFLQLLEDENTVKNYGLTLVTKNGVSLDLSASACMLVKDGRQMIEGILRDMTVSKQADRARAQNQKQIRAIAGSATDAIVTINDGREIIFWNAAAEKIFGYTQKEAIGQLVEIIIPKSFIGAHRKGFKRFVDGGEPHLIGKTVEVEALAKDGHEFPIELSMATWVLEGQSYFTSIIRDITARKKAEQALKDSEKGLVRKLEFERVISEVSSLLFNPGSLDPAINSSLKALGEFAKPTRVAIFLKLKDQDVFVPTYEWISKGAPSLMAMDIPVPKLSWLFSQVLEGQKVEISDLAELPDEGEDFRQFLLMVQVKSLLIMPLYSKGDVSGFIGFDNVMEQRAWRDDDRRLLSVAAQIIGGALELRETTEEIEAMAFHDPLTRLANRRLLEDRLNQALSFAKRREEMLALLFFDIDKFKPINNKFGHEAGDDVLKETASRLKARLRSQDTLARLGGDEFNVILSGIRDPRNALDIAKELMTVVSEEPFVIGSESISITVSVGISIFPLDGETVQDLMRNADIAMYSVKRRGGNDLQLSHGRDEEVA